MFFVPSNNHYTLLDCFYSKNWKKLYRAHNVNHEQYLWLKATRDQFYTCKTTLLFFCSLCLWQVGKSIFARFLGLGKSSSYIKSEWHVCTVQWPVWYSSISVWYIYIYADLTFSAIDLHFATEQQRQAVKWKVTESDCVLLVNSFSHSADITFLTSNQMFPVQETVGGTAVLKCVNTK